MSLTSEIIQLNKSIQQMKPVMGTVSLEKTFSQLQKLLDQLRLTNEDNPRYLLAWNLVAYYAQSDLKILKESFANTKLHQSSTLAKTTYEAAFAHFIEQLDLAISLLS
ncbi:hypothetical protein GO730_00260 [Spirosoma sp. HMF3257]|uniref:Uncharacterized protein n=1 Tax=Spirosoma telluris TaxID=2183553 RepID=A0A327NL03_9BACT|nr:hypothetical protein [Spirosoma telluris]RAI73238.1 hypothetical protein HMF3257_00255 [Spirosoma telluris]